MMSTRVFVLSTMIMAFGLGAHADYESLSSQVQSSYESGAEVTPVAQQTQRKKRKPSKAKKQAETRKPSPKVAKKPSAPAKAAVAAKVAPAKPAPAQQDQDEPAAAAKTGTVKVSKDALQGQLARFSHVDPKNLIAEEPLQRALSFYAMNQHKISNSRYLGVIDFSKNSSKPRFCIVNMKTGETECIKTSHGVGSDGGGGWAKSFSNRANSHASSVGYYKTLSTYSGKHGTSLRMDGLSASNSNALNRAVVVHGAWYVKDGNRATSGRSYGCPAVDDAKVSQVIAKLKGGAVIYAWHPKFMSEPSR